MIDLIRLDYHPTKNIRYAIYTGDSMSSERRTNNSIPFDFKKIEDNLYKITPQEPFGPGEYAFRAGISPMGGVMGSSFCDFGVSSSETVSSSLPKMQAPDRETDYESND